MKLFLFRGISGTGKSALAKEYGKRYSTEVFSTDDYFMVDGVYEWNIEHLIEYHRKNIDRTEDTMREGQPFVLVDNTHAKAWELKPYVKLALKYGYEIEILEPCWSSDLKDDEGMWSADFIETLQKNKDRAEQNKTLSRELIEKQRDKYDYNVTIDQILDSEIPQYVLDKWKEMGTEED